jgi:hypothetical protein
LAARNIFLSYDLKAKVADFGLSSRIDNDNQVLVGANQDLIPLCWSAIEVLTNGVPILEKSDVWSFGIVLWELFYLCNAIPYANISELPELLNYLRSRQRLDKPPLCPKSLYDLMLMCWKEHYQSRPSFSELKRELKHFQSIQSDLEINPIHEQSNPEYSEGRRSENVSQNPGYVSIPSG